MLQFIIYTLIAILTYMYFYKNTHDAMNPFGFSLSLFLFSLAANGLKLNASQLDLSIETHLLILLAALEIFVVGLINTHGLKKQKANDLLMPYISDNYKTFMWGIVSFVFIVFVISWRRHGSFMYITSNNDIYDIKAGSQELRGFSGIASYFVQILPHTALFVCYELLFRENLTKKQKIVRLGYIVIICFMIWFIFVSRGTLLVIAFGMLYLFNVKYHFSTKQVGITLLVLAISLGFLMTVRVSLTSGAFAGKTNNIYFNTIYNYFCMSYHVFDKLVKHGSPYTIISASWITLSNIIGVDANSSETMYTVDFYNSKSFLYGFYHDLGVLGIVFYPICIFTIIGIVYKKARTNKPYYYLYLATVQKALFVIFYGNYFFGSFSNDVPYYITIMLLFLSYRKR